MKELIDIVRNYPILYNPKHPNYRNGRQKDATWLLVSEQLNEDYAIVRNRWRNLRNSYGKYLKSKISTSLEASRYTNWLWAKEMDVFKPFLRWKWDDIEGKVDATRIDDSQMNDSRMDDMKMDDPLTFESYAIAESPIPKIERKRNHSSSQSPPSSPAKKMNICDQRRIQSSREFDSIDYLFLSYAKTIKMFPLRRQLRIKHEFARIVMQNEREHLDEKFKNATPAGRVNSNIFGEHFLTSEK